MAAVIIRQKDLKRLGKELLNEVFDFLHDEYILSEFKEMKEVQKVFLNKLILNHINTLHKQFKITEEKRQELYESLNDPLPLKLTSLDGKDESFEVKPKENEKEKFKENAMKDDGIDTEGIYRILISVNLDMEIDEDLYYKTKAFLDIFRVFETGYSYLE